MHTAITMLLKEENSEDPSKLCSKEKWLLLEPLTFEDTASPSITTVSDPKFVQLELNPNNLFTKSIFALGCLHCVSGQTRSCASPLHEKLLFKHD